VHLAKNEQFAESYAAVSAARLVPLLRDGDQCSRSRWRSSSTSTRPTPAAAAAGRCAGRARVRALALDIACEIHPLNNLRVLRYLVNST
jgi:maleylpyruvate isomerase